MTARSARTRRSRACPARQRGTPHDGWQSVRANGCPAGFGVRCAPVTADESDGGPQVAAPSARWPTAPESGAEIPRAEAADTAGASPRHATGEQHRGWRCRRPKHGGHLTSLPQPHLVAGRARSSHVRSQPRSPASLTCVYPLASTCPPLSRQGRYSYSINVPARRSAGSIARRLHNRRTRTSAAACERWATRARLVSVRM